MCTTGIAALPSGARAGALQNGVLVPSRRPLLAGFAPRAVHGDNSSHSHAGSSRCPGWHRVHRLCPSLSPEGIIRATAPCLLFPPPLTAGCGKASWWLLASLALTFPPSPAPTHSAHLSIASPPRALCLLLPFPRALREAVARGGEACCPGTLVPGANPASRSPGAAQGCGSL